MSFRKLSVSILAVLATIISVQAQEPETSAAAPMVRVAKVSALAQTEPRTFIGTVAARHTVRVVARVAGTLREDAFKEGSVVRKGDLLFAIEDTTYRANLAIADAVLKQALAERAIAKKSHDRNVQLLQESVVPQSTFDDTLHALELREARCEEAEARVLLAGQDLEYARIHAPVTGRVGKRRFGEGNYITPDSGVLATVVGYDPAYVEFPVSEVDFAAYFKSHDDMDNAALTLIRANGEPYAGRIALDMVDNQIDERTNTIMVRLTCENADFRLVPGGYMQVRLAHRFDTPLPAVPAQAVMMDGKTHFVFVVGPDDVVERRAVQVGEVVFRHQTILSGLTEGEWVVVGGMNKTGEGGKVTPIMEPVAE